MVIRFSASKITSGAKFFGDTPASLQWNGVLGPSRGPQAAALLTPRWPLPTCPAGARTRTETADFFCDLLSQVSFLGFPQTRRISLAEKKRGIKKANGLHFLKLETWMVEPPWNCGALPTPHGFAPVTMKVVTKIQRDSSQPCVEIPSCTIHPSPTLLPSLRRLNTQSHTWSGPSSVLVPSPCGS